jgi:hypothetical protein
MRGSVAQQVPGCRAENPAQARNDNLENISGNDTHGKAALARTGFWRG